MSISSRRMRSFRILLSTVPFLVFSTTVFAKPGFFNPLEPATPAAIAKASEAVYRYIVINDPPEKVKRQEYQDLLRRVSSGEFLRRLVMGELTSCEARKLQECEISYGGSGTAFVTGENHDHLMTANHNLYMDKERYREELANTPNGNRINIFAGKNERVLMRNMRLSFMLYDREGKVVFDTRKKGDYASPEVMGYGEMLNWMKGFHQETPVDFTSIRMNRPVGTVSLEFRNSNASKSDALAVLGFPSTTNTRELIEHQPDSDGLSQYYSMGAPQAVRSVLQFMIGPTFAPDEEAETAIAEHIQYADTESVQGFSGGPVVDADGKVAGILVGQWSASDSRYFTEKNAILLHSEWLTKNLAKFAP